MDLLPVLLEMYSFFRASLQWGLSKMVLTTSLNHQFHHHQDARNLLPWIMAITMAFLPARSILVKEAPFSTNNLGNIGQLGQRLVMVSVTTLGYLATWSWPFIAAR